MFNKLRNMIRVWLVNVGSLLSSRKRNTTVLSTETIIRPSAPVIEYQHDTYNPSPADLRNITHMLDAEAAELYGRSRFIRN